MATGLPFSEGTYDDERTRGRTRRRTRTCGTRHGGAGCRQGFHGPAAARHGWRGWRGQFGHGRRGSIMAATCRARPPPPWRTSRPGRRSHLVGNTLNLQRILTESRADGCVGGIRDQHAADARHVVAWIEGVPGSTEPRYASNHRQSPSRRTSPAIPPERILPVTNLPTSAALHDQHPSGLARDAARHASACACI